MQVFPTALLPSDGATENIKVIANGHAFRDMDIVYISNSADAAGDAAPLAPSGNGFFYVESASQDAFYLNNSMALDPTWQCAICKVEHFQNWACGRIC